MTNLYILFLAIAKAALLTGIGPALVIAIVLELRGVRIVAIGVEKVSRERQRPGELESGQILGSNPRFVSSFLSLARKVSAAGQLAKGNRLLAVAEIRSKATSPARNRKAVA